MIDPIVVGDAIQVLHFFVAPAIWYFVGRIRSIVVFVVVFAAFIIMWAVLDGCPLTLAANDFFSRGGVEGYYCNSFSEQLRLAKDAVLTIERYPFGQVGPYCDLYEWLQAKTGSRFAIFVKMIPLVALYVGMIVTRLRNKES